MEKWERLFRSRSLFDLQPSLSQKTNGRGQRGQGGWFRREHVIDAGRCKDGKREHANDQTLHRTLLDIGNLSDKLQLNRDVAPCRLGIGAGLVSFVDKNP